MPAPNPELPEIQRVVNALNEVVSGCRVTGAIADPDGQVFCEASSQEVVDALNSRTFVKVHRFGSFMYFSLEGDGGTAVLQLSGDAFVQIRGRAPLTVGHSRLPPVFRRDDPWPPRNYKLILQLQPAAGGKTIEVAFIDTHSPKRASRIYLCDDPLSQPPLSNLKYDPLRDVVPPEKFAEHILRKATPIKRLLVDGRFLAGVGDWVADEALYQSRIHPQEDGHSLNREQCLRLLDSIISICKIACQAESPREYPSSWLVNYRDSRKRTGSQRLKLENGTDATISMLDTGNAKSYFVKEVQVRTVKPEQFEYSDTITRKRRAEGELDGKHVEHERVLKRGRLG